MPDYTPHTWSPGDTFTAADATAMSQELDEQEAKDAAQDTAIAGKAASGHTHVSTNVTDFAEAVQDVVGAFVSGTSGVTTTYNDTTNTLSISGAGAQPVDSDLTAIAALTPANDDVIQRKAGAWTNRTMAQLSSDLGVSSGGPATAQFVVTKVGSTITATPRTGSGLSTHTGTDAYTVIQACIADLTPSGSNGSGGGSIHICTGEYFLSDELTITGWEGIVGSSSQPNSQLKITGDGLSTTIVQNTSGKNAFVIKNCANFSFRDFKIYAGSSAKSCILGDNTGSTSVMSCWKAVLDNIACNSDSTTQPAVLIKDFYEISAPWLRIQSTANHGVVLQQTDTSVKRGNSWFGSLVSGASTSSPYAGLKIESTTNASVIDMVTIDNYQCTVGAYYGIYLYGAYYNNVVFSDIENCNYCVYLDGPGTGSYQDSGNNTFYAGYWQPSGTGEGLHATTHAYGTTVKGVAIYTPGDGSRKPINDLRAGSPGSDYTVQIPNGSDISAISIAYPGTRLTAIGGGGVYTEQIPKLQARIDPRIGSTTSSATPTINTDNVDMYGLTAQAVDITSFTTNLSGTPANGDKLWIYVVGTAARAITWGSKFEAGPVALPTTTVTTQRLDVGFIWNSVSSKWRCVASGSA